MAHVKFVRSAPLHFCNVFERCLHLPTALARFRSSRCILSQAAFICGRYWMAHMITCMDLSFEREYAGDHCLLRLLHWWFLLHPAEAMGRRSRQRCHHHWFSRSQDKHIFPELHHSAGEHTQFVGLKNSPCAPASIYCTVMACPSCTRGSRSQVACIHQSGLVKYSTIAAHVASCVLATSIA